MNFELFDRDRRVLAAYCWPRPDELLSSWLSRMAYDHGISTKDFCELVMPVPKAKFDIDYHLPEDCIEPLALHTNCDAEIVRSTTLNSYRGKIFGERWNGKENWLMSSSSQGSRSSFSSRLMYCPDCLQKEPYFRKKWRLAASFVCVDCGCYLIDSCPHCGKGNSFVDKDCENHLYSNITEYMTTCHHCGEDVTDCDRIQAPDNVISAQRSIYQIIENGPENKEVPTSGSYFNILYELCRFLLMARFDTMSSRAFIKEAFKGAGVAQKYILPKYDNFYLDTVSAIKRASLLTVSTWLLEEWPNRFLGLCKQNNLTFKQLLCRFNEQEHWFTEQLCQLSFDPVKKVKQPVNKDREQYIIKVTKLPDRIDYDYDVTEHYFNGRLYDETETEVIDWIGFIGSCYGNSVRQRRADY